MANKYHARKTVVDGITFASAKEARRYGELKLLERGGNITSLELQPKFPIWIKGEKVFEYWGDFSYTENGKRIVEDVKSPATRTDIYRLKAKCVLAYYGIKITEV